MVMIVDILVRIPPADQTRTACWLTAMHNAYVVKDSPVNRDSALISTNVPQTPVQAEPYAATFPVATLVSALEVAQVIPIRAVAPNLPLTLAMNRIHARPEKNASRTHTAETAFASADKATSETPRASARISTNAKTRTSRHVASMRSARTYQEAMNVSVHPDSTETHSCRVMNVTAWNANVQRHTSLWMEIVSWTVADLMASAPVELSVSQSPEA